MKKILCLAHVFLLLGSIGNANAEEIESLHGIEYCQGDDVPLLMDIAYPSDIYSREPVPAVVLIHGGSWRGGLRGGMFDKAQDLARNGYFAATIDYRLTHYIEPQNRVDPMKAGANYLKMIQDVRCAVRHLKSAAASYHIDENRIATFGSSAGGHLATMVAVNHANWQDQNSQYQEVDSAVAAVVSWYGPQDLKHNYLYVPFTQFYLEALLEGTLSEYPERYYAASPINHLSPDDPPILTIHGTHDETVPVEVAKAFDRAARNHNVHHVLEIIEGGVHSLPHHREQAMERSIQFLDRILK